VQLSYAPYDFLVLSVKYFDTELIQKPVAGDSGVRRVQVDAVYKF
jgi:hypothetical protein